MSRRSRWIVRFVRLLTLCVAVLVARPAPAAPAAPPIVLVAEAMVEAATARSAGEDEHVSPPAASRAEAERAPAFGAAVSTPRVWAHGATREWPVAPKKYLLHCSLLR
ncbi:MAG: hypothetical protein KF764_07440 [Labilithrix sp.]|nr:hypothetical protein [Labilithrix sp.]